jgi:transcriptional regulator with XRE-family HTH domain
MSLLVDAQPAAAPEASGSGEDAENESSSIKKARLAVVRTFGARMIEARELCNLSQSVAAKRLGYANQSKLAKVENASDTNSVPFWLIPEASKVYEVSTDFLLGLSDDWEGHTTRGLTTWVADEMNRLRRQDLDALSRIERRVAVATDHLEGLATGAEAVASALEEWRDRNPGFDDTPLSGTLAGRMERLQEQTKAARRALGRLLRPTTTQEGD